MNTNNGQKTTKRSSLFRANPVMNRVTKINERAEDGHAATYGGIAMKTGFLLLMTVVGIVGYLVAQLSVFQYQDQIEGLNYKGFAFAISIPQAITILAASVIAIVAQLLAAFVPKTIPVTGTLYSLCQGVIISGVIFTILGGQHMEYLGLLALAVTVVVVLTMAILYATGVIKVTKKFRAVLLTLLISMLGLSLVILVCSFIPGVNGFVSSIMNNFWISIIMTLISIVIATMFLISEFAAVQDMVEGQVPAKYEWYAAFGLSFALLWLYVKILDLIIQIAGKNNK